MPALGPQRKPCACGWPDCEVVQRTNEKPHAWKMRRYASLACASMMRETEKGAVVTPPEWLDAAMPAQVDQGGLDFLEALWREHPGGCR